MIWYFVVLELRLHRIFLIGFLVGVSIMFGGGASLVLDFTVFDIEVLALGFGDGAMTGLVLFVSAVYSAGMAYMFFSSNPNSGEHAAKSD